MFLVFKLARTGSTMFGKVLNSHKEIVCNNEILNHLKENNTKQKIEYLNQYLLGKTFNDESIVGNQIIGGTINPFKYRLSSRSLQGIIYSHSRKNIVHSWVTKNINRKEPSVQVILLLRKNLLKQAISIETAKKEGTYYSTQTRFQNKNLLKKQDFDLSKLEEEVSRLQRTSEKLIKFTKAVTSKYLPIFYEDIYQHPEETYKKVFDYIEVSNVQENFDFTGGYKKILSDNIEDIINNFDDIYKYPLLKTYL